jgi:hypothetical protein
MLVALDDDDNGEQRVDRARVPSSQTSHVFGGLRSATRYLIGVVAFVDHEPRQVYKLYAKTSSKIVDTWSTKPSIQPKGIGKFSVQWENPRQFAQSEQLKSFIVEYRLPNETT